MAEGARAPMVVTPLGGPRYEVDIRGHRIVVDQPAGVGDDTGPMPLELMGASLGTCIAFYIGKFLQARQLTTEGLRVEVVQHPAREPYRIGRFEVTVALPEGTPAEYLDMLQRVARSCPVHNTLEHTAEVTLGIGGAA